MPARRLSLLLLLGCLSLNLFAQAPSGWQVTGVQAGGQLNVRKGPSTDFGIVGTLAHDATGLKNFGCYPSLSPSELDRLNEQEQQLADEMTWCRISHESIFGWVQARFLTE